ncbi:MAG: GH1 family beta-glucosidase [Azospirillaceae bacterium]
MTLPHGVLRGVATSAWQIEGATREGGRGPSIWDRFARRPGAIRTGETGDKACDHYHRWREDIALIADLGCDAYRFSVAWPRIQPEGRGRPNPDGLDFYDRLVDGLAEAGIAPVVCLYHWDLPEALQDRGGWTNRETVPRFAEYAWRVADRLGDRVSTFFMMNEANIHARLGHLIGVHAPGVVRPDAFLRAMHHQTQATAEAMRALDEESRDWRLGTILSLAPVSPGDDSQSAEEAAHRLDSWWNGAGLDPLVHGRYPEAIAETMDSVIDHDAYDLERMHRPPDVIGVNYYHPLYARPDRDAPLGLAVAEAAPGAQETTAMGWGIEPDRLEAMLLRLKADYGDPALMVTETGAAFDDRPDAEGRIRDPRRIAFLESHLDAIARAIDGGAKVEGVFVWSLLDNVEWAEGTAKRFGLVHVDFETQTRTPKDSYRWLQEQWRG